ncbi:hypothetical protein [Sulfitobacter sp. PS-8MA]|uniref:hypothetical protein n=1 Tax=Sulfitobacter sp. PS-8MA TaxID=3237707 RepID=UPI0034C62978
MTVSNLTNVLSGLLLSIALIFAAAKIWHPSDEQLFSQFIYLPTLSFPDTDGKWGCKFYNSCEN